jgi:hypothetical protein
MSIICHSHKFIFLKTRKTAGSSIEISLARFCGPEDTVVPPKEGDEYGVLPRNLRKDPTAAGFSDHVEFLRLFLRAVVRRKPLRLNKMKDHAYSRYGLRIKEHADAARMRAAVGEGIWNSYFKFCIERNPWERLVSFYRWRSKQLAKPLDFKSFVKAALTADTATQKRVRAIHFSNWPFYTIEDQPVLDYIGRFERLDEELSFIADKIGIPWDGWLPQAKSFGPPANGYHELFDQELRELCEQAFRKEAELFGYSMDS